MSNLFNGNTFSLEAMLPYFIGLYGVGTLSYFMRNVPGRIFAWIKKHCLTTLTITSENRHFIRLVELFENEKLVDHSRHLRFFERRFRNEIYKGFGEGSQMFLFRHRIIWLHHSVELLKDSQLNKISITIIGRDQSFFDDLKAEVDKAQADEMREDTNKIIVYNYVKDNWQRVSKIKKRTFDTIFIDKFTKNTLVNHLERFYSSEDWYDDRGIPYQRGILLYGEPGTGKTSIIKALAGKFEKRLCVFRVADLCKLSAAMQNLPSDSFVVIEDVDTNKNVHQRRENINQNSEICDDETNIEKDENTKGNKAILSDILNAIDGIMSVNGRVLFLTTNHIETLDKAFIRPGRIDLSINISYVSKEAFIKFINVFYADTLSFTTCALLSKICRIEKVTISQLQNHFMLGMKIETLISKYCTLKTEHRILQRNEMLRTAV
ncbi:MAG: hypothetical protein Ta2B_13210 [Termitinemataceae bacterium]|nr:MAG: hypothetical protein Ta2B_13210 [Termitinemataceae bacterium]